MKVKLHSLELSQHEAFCLKLSVQHMSICITSHLQFVSVQCKLLCITSHLQFVSVQCRLICITSCLQFVSQIWESNLWTGAWCTERQSRHMSEPPCPCQTASEREQRQPPSLTRSSRSVHFHSGSHGLQRASDSDPLSRSGHRLLFLIMHVGCWTLGCFRIKGGIW